MKCPLPNKQHLPGADWEVTGGKLDTNIAEKENLHLFLFKMVYEVSYYQAMKHSPENIQNT